jgi:hypothetical protein
MTAMVDTGKLLFGVADTALAWILSFLNNWSCLPPSPFFAQHSCPCTIAFQFYTAPSSLQGYLSADYTQVYLSEPKTHLVGSVMNNILWMSRNSLKSTQTKRS